MLQAYFLAAIKTNVRQHYKMMCTYLLSVRMLSGRRAVPCFNAAYGTAKMELCCDWPVCGAADNFLYAHFHLPLTPSRKSFTIMTLTAWIEKATPLIFGMCMMSLLAKGCTAAALSYLLCTGTQAVTFGVFLPAGPAWQQGNDMSGTAGRQIERDNLRESIGKTNMQ